MKLLITGGAGFLGARLARELLRRGRLAGRAIAELVLADLVVPADRALTGDPRVRLLAGDLLGQMARIEADRFDGVFHLAAAVSAQCEADFDLGLRANLDTTLALLQACRAGGQAPRLVFASSVAVFGNDPGLPLPPVVRDDTLPTPQSSYGVQKFIGEQMVADFTRRGYLDGRAARLMTVSVRPGRPNAAASSFLSGIVREPLAGEPAVCPVAPDCEVALASPQRTIAGLITVYEATRDDFGGRTAINLPALAVRVSEIVAALRRAGGDDAVALLRFERDAAIERIVGSWPARFESARAAKLGLRPDPDVDSILLQYLHDHPDAVRNEQARRLAGHA